MFDTIFSKHHLKELFSLNIFECGSNFSETANIFSDNLYNPEISKLNFGNLTENEHLQNQNNSI